MWPLIALCFVQTVAEMAAAEARDAELASLVAAAAREEAVRVASGGPVRRAVHMYVCYPSCACGVCYLQRVSIRTDRL